MHRRSKELPAAALSGDAAPFAQYLEDAGQDYLVVEQVDDDQRAHVRFCGVLLGQAVVWDCQFVTLAAEQTDGRARGADAATAARNFIEVGERTPRGVSLRVGLALAHIDRPAIEKMIVMIRNYKRLRPGRHEYGQPQSALNREA